MATGVDRIKCADCPIRHRAICSRCDDAELDELDRIKFYRTFEKGTQIARRDETLEVLGSVVRGVASLSQSIEDGRTQMVGLLFPSDFIGRPGREALQYDVTAVTDVTLCCFHRKPFERLLQDMPHVRERLLEMTMDELDAARDWMLLLGRKSAREKIASLLALIQRRSTDLPIATGNISKVDLPISREAIGDYLGLTIETVSRQMTGLRKDGLIELDGARSVIIPDLPALMAETGDHTIRPTPN